MAQTGKKLVGYLVPVYQGLPEVTTDIPYKYRLEGTSSPNLWVDVFDGTDRQNENDISGSVDNYEHISNILRL